MVQKNVSTRKVQVCNRICWFVGWLFGGLWPWVIVSQLCCWIGGKPHALAATRHRAKTF
jgi:lauroyl/myristoyl acyltransferase